MNSEKTKAIIQVWLLWPFKERFLNDIIGVDYQYTTSNLHSRRKYKTKLIVAKHNNVKKKNPSL